jgi:transcriptional regulator with XRE-family HTH domain
MDLSLGAIISQARKRKNLTQGEVARQIDMKLSTYAKKETDGGFTEEQLKKLSKLLQLKLVELQKAKERGVVIIPDAIKTLIEKALVNEACQRVLLEDMAYVIAEMKKMKVGAVRLAQETRITDVLAQLSQQYGSQD